MAAVTDAGWLQEESLMLPIDGLKDPKSGITRIITGRRTKTGWFLGRGLSCAQVLKHTSTRTNPKELVHYYRVDSLVWPA